MVMHLYLSHAKNIYASRLPDVLGKINKGHTADNLRIRPVAPLAQYS